MTVRTLDVGHMVFWDAFEATAAIVGAFLAGGQVSPGHQDGTAVEAPQRMA